MRRRTFVAVPLAVALSACGGSTPTSANPAGTDDAAAATVAPGSVQGRLQGSWEIVRYESVDPIAPEAMPLMGELFETLRLNVKGAKLSVDAKESRFVASDAGDGAFTLATDGMFNGARCRFVADDSWEVDDQGEVWPGKSVLKRAR